MLQQHFTETMAQLALTTTNPKVLLVASRALAALRPSLLAFLIANAAILSSGTKTPISFCNVLFVGNLCAALTVVAWFGWRPIWTDLRQLDRRSIVGLVINGCLASLLSALIFVGLQSTTVTNAVLLARLGPVLYALAGALFLGNKIQRQEWFGFSLIVVGILAIVLKTSNYQLMTGDLLILGSTVAYAASALLGKIILTKDANLRVMVFTRNFVSAVIFFAIATSLFGLGHFGDVFSGQLWIVMTIYALIIIVLAQFLWYAALEKLDSTTVAKWTVLSPVFGVSYALVLNGERPEMTQVLAFIVIMTGVIISSYSKRSPQQRLPKSVAGGAESCASS